MLTPLFSVDQNSDTVIVSIRVPFSRPRDFTVSTVGTSFHFHCRPYLLHLSFPHSLRPVTDDDPSFAKSTASYDFDSGIATVVLVKASPGLHFPALSCLSKLIVGRTPTPGLEPRKPSPASIAVVSSTKASGIGRADVPAAIAQSKSEFSTSTSNTLLDPTGNSLLSSVASICIGSRSWVMSPEVVARKDEVANPPPILSLGAPCYGFGDRYSEVFVARAEDAGEIVELSKPDTTPATRRRQLRSVDEVSRFDPEHYIADFMLASELEGVVRWQPQADLAATDLRINEQDALLKLPYRSYLDDIEETSCADLAGIVFASLYDLRASAGERNVESAWTISRITPVLSWLEHAESVEDAVRSSFARSLVYPLYRSLGVAYAVLADMKRLFQGSVDNIRKRLLRLLLDVREVFEDAVVLRIFSDIFFIDYCVWIQHVPDVRLQNMANAVGNVSISVSTLPWDLNRLQRYALQVDQGLTPDDDGPVWTWDGQPHATASDDDDDDDEGESESSEYLDEVAIAAPMPFEDYPAEHPGKPSSPIIITACDRTLTEPGDSRDGIGLLRAVATKQLSKIDRSCSSPQI
jgi:protein SHQ1